MAPDQQSDIDNLKTFLRLERSAVEAYNQCINHLSSRSIISVLSDLQQSHQRRVRQLSARIEELGSTPVEKTQMWSSLARLLDGAESLTDETAIRALVEGEDHERADYERALNQLTPATRQFLATHILPEQVRGREMLNQLQRQP